MDLHAPATTAQGIRPCRMIGNQNPRWMGLDAGRLGMAIAACALAGACFGGGGIDYETLAQENRSAAPYSFQYLGVAGTREDAVNLAEDMVDRKR